MNFNINWAGTAVLAGLCWGCSATAQQADTTPPKVLHTVPPTEFSLAAAALKSGEVTTRLLPDGKAFSVADSAGKTLIIIELGSMPAAPNTSYYARTRLRVEKLEETANVSLMMRELPAPDGKPIQPYHRTPSNLRDLEPEPAGAWLERGLTFTTGPDTHALSGAIIITGLKGELHLGAFELLDGAPAPKAAAEKPIADKAQMQAEYQQMMNEVRAQAATRTPLTPRPLVFSRSQMKYDLGKNYYHQWNDRPLLTSREFRVESPYVTPLPSYRRTLEAVKKYDIDGLAFFPATKGRMAMFEAHQKAGVEGVGLLPEFLAAYAKDDIGVKTEILQRALASPDTPRIGGKVLITSYGAQSLTPAEWKKILTTLRERVGDRFIFLPSLTNVVALRSAYMEGEPITRAALEKERAYLRSYLDVCDGIYFNYPPALRNKDHTFDAEFYRDIFIPIFKSVLSEPAYRNKYLGLSAYRSHMSPERGNNLHEDGTRTLRTSFEAAMEARPDIILLPEWDEANENTSFRPTVYGGTTTGRILRYYMSEIKGKAATPFPGDDVSVPNLILSTRKIATLGENLNIELLNVPDGSAPANYSVALTLQDENGKTVRAFEPVTFSANKLQEHRFELATEEFPAVRALVPVLTIRGYKGRDLTFDSGFHATQIRATWNWDHLYVKQPLRDLLRPATATLAWKTPAQSGQPLTLTATVSAPENLNVVELLGDDDEVYAVDSKDEFFRDDPARELFLIEYRSQNNLEMEGKLTLKNGNARWLDNGSVLHQANYNSEVKSNEIQIKTPVSIHQRPIYLSIPKSEVAKAELNFDFDKAKFSLPLGDVVKEKLVARGFENGLHISVQPYHRQPDMPSPLGKKQVSFQVQVTPEIATEQFHLRMIAPDGKIFRSRPLLLPTTATPTATTSLRVYSETQKRGVDVPVAASRVPELRYDFAPARGAVLLTEAGRPFWATLGGFSNTTTGRGTINGLFRGKYPANVERSAPQWVSDAGKPALEFDGKGTYLELPREALPFHGAFTLDFEVKPATAGDQILLANHTVSGAAGLTLEIRDGKLQAFFRDADWKTHKMPTNLAVPANVWSAIEVRDDFEKITLSVNGKSEEFPLTLPAFNIGFTVIGEGGTGNAFAGRLRDLRIVHNAR